MSRGSPVWPAGNLFRLMEGPDLALLPRSFCSHGLQGRRCSKIQSGSTRPGEQKRSRADFDFSLYSNKDEDREMINLNLVIRRNPRDFPLRTTKAGFPIANTFLSLRVYFVFGTAT